MNTNIMFLDSIDPPVILSHATGVCLCLQVSQSAELVPISIQQHQYKIGCRNQAQYTPSARVKTNIKDIKKTPHM
jgi:hypothetical protein